MMMTYNPIYFGLFFFGLIISTVLSREEYFYQVSGHDNSFLDTDIVALSNIRIKRFEPLKPDFEFPQPSKRISKTKENINGTKQGTTPSNFLSIITNETLLNHNISKLSMDSHTYYNSTTINDKSTFNNYWIDLRSNPSAKIYNASDYHHDVINLKFQFPFYGHLINSTTIATEGFLHLGNDIKSWLAATQYIAPFMANFDLSTSNDSDSNIYYLDNDTALTVTWHNVILQDKPELGKFNFQTTLYANGNIVLTYKNVPINIKDINSTYPVKIGLSDAYIMEKTNNYTKMKVLNQYHKITFQTDEVSNGTVIILTALPTCLGRKNCTSCMKKDIGFECYWCDNRCSSGIDRDRQEWLKKGCEQLKFTDENICIADYHGEIFSKPESGKFSPINFDFPPAITNETLLSHNVTKLKNDSHIFYKSMTINDKSVFENYWVDLMSHPNANVHEMLSDSHRRAATLNLKFQFPFYGFPMNSTTITTGGFLYLGDYIHSWLAATQYIAPLMANFDLSTSNNSNIYYMDNDTAFTVTWHNVVLQDEPSAGEFTFQTTLHSNGNIVFAYKHIPINIKEINATNHPVKIGLSDAYVMDKMIYFLRRKTIYEYHRIAFQEMEITNGTVIILTPLPTCVERKNCTSCMKNDTNLKCFWCDNRCSSGVDRNRQEWQKKDCEKLRFNDEDICTDGIGTPTLDNSHKDKFDKPESHADSSHSSKSLFFIALLISIIIMSTIWVLYAYLNPHTPSGQMLIRYRPTQWGWRKGEARYTAATIHM